MDFNILQLKDTKLYNFSDDENPNIHFEFLHQFDELYMNYLTLQGYFGYENEYITVNENDVVIDCGGNMGLFAAWAASKGGKVHSFEPGKTALKYLNKTKELYPNNITIIPKAVFDKETTLDYIECMNIGGSHISMFNINYEAGFKKEYPVQTIILDEYFQNQKIDFIKIDAEGSEEAIIKGAKNILQNHAPKLVIACYHFYQDNIILSKLISSINPKYNIIEKDNKLFCWVNNDI